MAGGASVAQAVPRQRAARHYRHRVGPARAPCCPPVLSCVVTLALREEDQRDGDALPLAARHAGQPTPAHICSAWHPHHIVVCSWRGRARLSRCTWYRYIVIALSLEDFGIMGEYSTFVAFRRGVRMRQRWRACSHTQWSWCTKSHLACLTQPFVRSRVSVCGPVPEKLKSPNHRTRPITDVSTTSLPRSRVLHGADVHPQVRHRSADARDVGRCDNPFLVVRFIRDHQSCLLDEPSAIRYHRPRSSSLCDLSPACG